MINSLEINHCHYVSAALSSPMINLSIHREEVVSDQEKDHSRSEGIIFPKFSTSFKDLYSNATTHQTTIEESNVRRLEKGLARARAAIRKAVRTRSYKSNRVESFIPRGSIYRNPYAFHQLRISHSFPLSPFLNSYMCVL
ncbi:hypothetical protein RHSIM_Rhsim02G0203000 [Rhododendron simsii]|uniref:Uncharacterized protein n=1 Tax=Rhododendron simsii TaxID=118357 RepID=A0A834HKR6_RHOSS|nr:hypothetical protein RHSIM_Rhsim02G0203000 [Rhododendron simsii]